MTVDSRNRRVFWTTAVLVIGVDILTKWLAVRYLLPHIPRRVIGDFARLTLAFNPGAAFSMSLGQYSRELFGTFAVAALFILWRIYRTTAANDTIKVLAVGLCWGGAAGNLVDRIRSSIGVVDFIDIGVGNVRFYTFNAADSAVTIGALLLAWVLWQEDRHRAMHASHTDATPSADDPGAKGAAARGA